MESDEYQSVFLDTHHYEVFDTYELMQSEEKHLASICGGIGPSLRRSALPAIVGEWSLATTDCTKWLNGSVMLHPHVRPPPGHCVGGMGG